MKIMKMKNDEAFHEICEGGPDAATAWIYGMEGRLDSAG
jgi:hypothetical protein